MRGFLIKLLLFACLVAAGFALLLRWRPKDEANQYVNAIADKEARLAATVPPRLILVGGSNLAFGVESIALEQAVGLPTTNLAITAVFGTEFILNQAAAHVRSRDVIVLSLEYYLFTGEAPQASTLATALETFPGSWRYLRAPQWKALLDGGLVHLSHIARTSLANARGYHALSGGVYRRDHFNDHGDMTAHHGLPSVPIVNRPPKLPPAALHTTLESIAAFVALCKARGATVYFELPPWPAEWISAHPEIVGKIHTGLLEIPGLVVLNTPAQAGFPREAFFDTEYHLTQAGGKLRTDRLIESLSAARPR